MKSSNYKEHIWINYDSNGNVINPYKLLPPLFKDVDNTDDFKCLYMLYLN